MPRTKEPKFKVGDAVEIINFAPDVEVKGIVVEIKTDIEPQYRLCFFEPIDEFEEIDMDKDCKNTLTIIEERLIRCRKKYCKECEYNRACPDLKEIVRCDISEFGQLRGEGKYNSDVCWQRKCIHTSMCLTNRWLQEQC
jgi:hypothetical protein